MALDTKTYWYQVRFQNQFARNLFLYYELLIIHKYLEDILEFHFVSFLYTSYLKICKFRLIALLKDIPGSHIHKWHNNARSTIKVQHHLLAMFKVHHASSKWYLNDRVCSGCASCSRYFRFLYSRWGHFSCKYDYLF